jgi:ligand-binding sensor domain-containing protein
MRGAHGARDPMLAGMLLASMCLMCSPCAFALNPALDASQYAHNAWNNRDGFSRGFIPSIAQTPDGYLWLGTEFGLFRFDGVRAVLWQPPPNQHLPSNYIAGLLSGRDGALWIGTQQGLTRWQGGKLTQYPELAGELVMPLIEDHDGTLWAGGFAYTPPGKLCAIQRGVVKCYGEDGSLGDGVLGLYEDRRGNLWAGTRTGLWRWRPGSPKFYPLPRELYGIQGLAENDRELLIALRGRVARLVDGKAETVFQYPVPARQSYAAKMLRDRDGSLWIGTVDHGLVHIHQGRTDLFARADGLSSDTVTALFEDREGNVWVATTAGLDRFRDFAVVTYSGNQGLPEFSDGSVLAARDGSIWADTSDGLSRWTQGQLTIFHGPGVRAPRLPAVREVIDKGLPHSEMFSLFQDDGGRIWIAGMGGAGYLENDRFVSLSGIPGGIVYSMAEGTGGDLWIANLDHGLLQVRGGRLVEQIPWARLGDKGQATALAADVVQGGLWLGFYQGGVVHWKDGQVQASYTAAEGLGEGTVKDLRLGADGTLWAATEGGLSRFKNGRIVTLGSKNGLPCDAVNWVREDDDQSLWLYMACGLVRIARSEVRAWDADPNRTIQATVFDGLDGVQGRAVGPIMSPRAAKSPDGKLWFATADGVSVVDPSHLPFNKLPPPVYVETVKVNGREVAAAEGMELSHGSNDLEIDYTALSLTIPERVRFRYKLEGKDTDWQDVGTRRWASYGGLKPKRYRFRVMASNESGVWNEAGAVWNFSIVPAFYQTAWFDGLCVVAGAGLLWLLYWLRVRQVTARVNLLYTERLAERTRIARDLHDTLLQSLAGVSLQLDGISKQAAKAPEKVPSLIGRVREQVDSAFREARVKVWNLRSTSLDVQGLEGALRQLVERIGPAMTARCGVTVSGQPRPCSHEIEEELLRIAQEAANNANRHAHATEIQIALDYGVNSLTLSISDDGRGFDFEEGYGKPGHWGLKNMQERAAQVRGTSKITTAVGKGTQIEVRVPLSSWSLRNTLAKHAHSNSGSR